MSSDFVIGMKLPLMRANPAQPQSRAFLLLSWRGAMATALFKLKQLFTLLVPDLVIFNSAMALSQLVAWLPFLLCFGSPVRAQMMKVGKKRADQAVEAARNREQAS